MNDALAHVLPGLDAAEYPRVAERYRHHFLARRRRHRRCFPASRKCFAELRAAGYLLAVATGKSRRGLDRALDATGLAPYFHATRCADEGHSKPHPGMLQAADAMSWVSRRSSTLMIGDTTHDLEMARAAGVARLGVALRRARAARRCSRYEPLACLGSVRGAARLARGSTR